MSSNKKHEKNNETTTCNKDIKNDKGEKIGA